MEIAIMPRAILPKVILYTIASNHAQLLDKRWLMLAQVSYRSLAYRGLNRLENDSRRISLLSWPYQHMGMIRHGYPGPHIKLIFLS